MTGEGGCQVVETGDSTGAMGLEQLCLGQICQGQGTHTQTVLVSVSCLVKGTDVGGGCCNCSLCEVLE